MADGGVVSLYGYLARVLRVVDSDTLDLSVDLGMNVHVTERARLLGVNGPETYGVKKDSAEYAAGIELKEWLMTELGAAFDPKGHPIDTDVDVRIITTKDKKGKYGRYLVELFVGDDEESINVKLIKMGFGADY